MLEGEGIGKFKRGAPEVLEGGREQGGGGV